MPESNQTPAPETWPRIKLAASGLVGAHVHFQHQVICGAQAPLTFTAREIAARIMRGDIAYDATNEAVLASMCPTCSLVAQYIAANPWAMRLAGAKYWNVRGFEINRRRAAAVARLRAKLGIEVEEKLPYNFISTK